MFIVLIVVVVVVVVVVLPIMASFFSQFSKKDGGSGSPNVKVAQSWVDDTETDCCANCNVAISSGLLFSGKHHCRLCGLVVCSACSTKRREIIKGQGQVRVCDQCYEVSTRADTVEAKYKPFLQNGEMFKKHPGSSGAFTLGRSAVNPRFVYLTKSLDAIAWAKPTDRANQRGCIPVHTITAVLKGQQSMAFRKTGISPELEQRCFTIVGKDRTLDLEAASMEQRDAWVVAVGEYTKFFKMEKPQDKSMDMKMDLALAACIEEQEETKRRRKERNNQLREKYNLKKG